MTTITVKKLGTRVVSIKPKKCQNPLFLKWIGEWLTEAIANNSNLRFGYRKAITSLMKYPIKLESGRACAILQDFGPKLCARLDHRLAEHLLEATDLEKNIKPATPKINLKRNPKKADTQHYMQKQDDKERTGMSSTVASVTNNLKPAYSTTTDKQVPTPVSPAKQSVGVSQDDSVEDIILRPGCFRVILLVDNAEVFGNMGNKGNGRETHTRAELTALNIEFQVRSLKVGDYTWIAQDVTSGKELVLPYIVERKRLDDLAGSIKDGRYHEQKFRLKECGIQNLIYLIESMGKGDLHLSLSLKAIQQASINTQIQGGFIVKHTSTHLDSMEYLAVMTKIITRKYQEKILIGCLRDNMNPSDFQSDIIALMSFNEFNQAALKEKKWCVQDMFIKHLIQLRGLSIEKATAVVDAYPTPLALATAFQAAGDKGPSLLADIKYGEGKKRSIGPLLSITLHQLYTSQQLK